MTSLASVVSDGTSQRKRRVATSAPASCAAMKPGASVGLVRCEAARRRSCAHSGNGGRKKRRRRTGRHFIFYRMTNWCVRPRVLPREACLITDISHPAAGAHFAMWRRARCNCRKRNGQSRDDALEPARARKSCDEARSYDDAVIERRGNWSWIQHLSRHAPRWRQSRPMKRARQRCSFRGNGLRLAFDSRRLTA